LTLPAGVQETFRLCQQHCDGVVLVDNAKISAAIKDVFTETRSILEPAGAVAVAGAKDYLKRHNMKVREATSVAIYLCLLAHGHALHCQHTTATPHQAASLCLPRADPGSASKATFLLVQGATVVAVTSGANMNFDRLRLVADLANYGLRTEAMLTCTIPERPGTFRAFVETLYGDHQASSDMALDGAARRGVNVTEFKYRYSVDRDAKILLSISAWDPAAVDAAVARLNETDGDFRCNDITDNALAQVHLRHMVGGRPRSYSGAIQDEKMVVVRCCSSMHMAYNSHDVHARLALRRYVSVAQCLLHTDGDSTAWSAATGRAWQACACVIAGDLPRESRRIAAIPRGAHGI
jgi:threonine dehydratase